MLTKGIAALVRATVVLLALLSVGASLACGGTSTAFGPKTYLRQTGVPVVVTDTFSIADTSAHYSLRVTNSRIFIGKEKERLSRASITLNGVSVIEPSQFGVDNTSVIQVAVSLHASNTLDVEVFGPPAGTITVEIIAGMVGTFTALGTKVYERQHGDDDEDASTDTFSVSDPSSHYILRVTNSELSGHEDKDDKSGTNDKKKGDEGDQIRVSNGSIRINGRQVVDPRQFGNIVSTLEVPVLLEASNEISVQVKDEPGGKITLEIVGGVKGLFNVFGVKTYQRDTGSPNAVVDSFPAPDPVIPYLMLVENSVTETSHEDGSKHTDAKNWKGGDEKEKPQKDDEGQASTALVSINGVQIIDRDDFGEGLALLDLPVALAASNQIAVKVSGKPSSTITVLILGLETTAPSIKATVTPPPNANGWNNTDVLVTFTCSAVSGVATCPSPQNVTTEGANQIIQGSVVDNAGNTATVSVALNIDKTPPFIVATQTPSPNAAGWNNTNVMVTFTCTDATSGVAICPSPVVITQEGASQIISGTATDKAGNSATTSVKVNIDKTPPTLIFGSAIPSANSAGWNNTNVSIPFTTADNLSGVASTSLTSPLIFATEGEGLTQTVTVTDVAGNSATFKSPSVNIDKTPPTVVLTSPPAGFITNSATLTVGGTVTDKDPIAQVSVNGTPVSLTNGAFSLNTSLISGSNSFTVTAADIAGNTTTLMRTVILLTPGSLMIVSPPPTAAVVGQLLQYQVIAESEDPGSLTFSLLAAPLGMAIDSKSGLLTWTPGSGQAGDQPVTIGAQDSGGKTSQSFTLSVFGSRSVASARISAATGGVITVTDPTSKINGLSIDFPASALASDTTITISELTSPPTLGGTRHFLLKGFSIEPNGISLAFPATITIPYSLTEFDTSQGIPLEHFLGIYFLDSSSGNLQGLKNFAVDTRKHVVTGTISHFSVWELTNIARLCPPPTSQNDCPNTYSPGSNQLPTITVHGFIFSLGPGFGDETTWGRLRYMLGQTDNGLADRVDAWRFDYDSAHTSFETSAGNLALAIDSVKQFTNKTLVNIVAHSFGGILVRTYLEDQADFGAIQIELYSNRHDVNRLMTLGTPHTGIGGDLSIGFANLCALAAQVLPDTWITCFETSTGVGGGQLLNSLNSLPLPDLESPVSPQFDIVIGQLLGQRLPAGSIPLIPDDGLITVSGAALPCSGGCPAGLTVEAIASSGSDPLGLCHSTVLLGLSPFGCGPSDLPNVAMAAINEPGHPLWKKICLFLDSNANACNLLSPTIVPNVVGLPESTAQSEITMAGLVLGTVTTVNSSTVPAGSVILEDPAAGTSVAQGTAVNLTVSSAPPPGTAVVPNVVGLTQAAAQSAIVTTGLVVGTVTSTSSSSVPAGDVITQNPAPGTLAPLGTAVNLTVSSGPPPGFASLTVTLAGGGTGTVTSTPPGISCGPTCTASFAAGALVQLTAMPAAGSTFAGWSGNCTGSAPTTTVVLSGSQTCIAAFTIPGALTFTFQQTDFPGASRTTLTGINKAGDVVGDYSIGGQSNCLLLTGGTFSTLQTPPGCAAPGISASGQIVGSYPNPSGFYAGFLLTNGTLTAINAPGFETLAYGINSSGEIVGTYRSAGCPSFCGFLRTSGGAFQLINPPGTSANGAARGINDAGEIVGSYGSAPNVGHGFFLQGGYTTIDYPGASVTFAYGINAKEQIVGNYLDASSLSHGFLFIAGKFTRIDFPGATQTFATGINDSGTVVGYYYAPDGTHGFVATLSTSVLAPVYDITDLGTLSGADSHAYGVTDLLSSGGLGAVVGVSTTSTNIQHAFVWRPSTGMVDLTPGDGRYSAAVGAHIVRTVIGDFCCPTFLVVVGNQSIPSQGSGWGVTFAVSSSDVPLQVGDQLNHNSGDYTLAAHTIAAVSPSGLIVGNYGSGYIQCNDGGYPTNDPRYNLCLFPGSQAFTYPLFRPGPPPPGNPPPPDSFVTQLPPIPGDVFAGPQGYASGVNAKDEVVGATGGFAFAYDPPCNGSPLDCFNASLTGSVHHDRIYRAAFWASGTRQDLGSLGGSGRANAISDTDRIVGSSVTSAGQWHATIWTLDGKVSDMGTLGGTTSEAFAITAAGDLIVGAANTSFGRAHAFVYSDTLGMIDLSLALPPGSGWELTEARGINSAGQIVGSGTHNGQTHAFLLTPHP